MAKCNNKNRGFSSRDLRRLREESFVKTLNRKQNLIGCTARNARIAEAEAKKCQIQ